MTKVINHMGRLALGCGLLLVGAFLTGCQSGGSDGRFAEVPGIVSAAPAGTQGSTPASEPAATTQGVTVPTAATAPAGDSPDLIRVGDVLTITFADLPAPGVAPIEDRVRDDGTITLLQNQTFTVAGKTRGQLEKEIRERYVPRFYVTMTVTVRPQRDTQFYYVGGEVREPGRQVYISRITVTKAIQSAGDFTDFAGKRKVKLFRVNGKVETIDCKKALEDPKLDPEVLPGDKIHVPRSIL